MVLTESTENIVENGNGANNKEEDLQNNPDITIKPNPLTATYANLMKSNGKLLNFAFKSGILLAIWIYFGFATYYQISNSGPSINSTTCSGYGFLIIVYSIILFVIAWNLSKQVGLYNVAKNRLVKPVKNEIERIFRIRFVNVAFYLLLLIGFLVYIIIDTSDNRNRLIPLSGLCFFLLFGYVFSKYPKNVNWTPVIWGLILQIGFGLVTIRWDIGRNIFDCAGSKVTTFLSYATNGSAVTYGNFLVYDQKIFAFQAITTIYFLAFMINILYHYGLLQKFVVGVGSFLHAVMDTTICESVNSAANIFLGQTEAPLLLVPFLKNLTDSEIHSILTSGFATVSGKITQQVQDGAEETHVCPPTDSSDNAVLLAITPWTLEHRTVLAAYISFGAEASHLITSSVMSAPAALCFSKLFYPEVQVTLATKESIALTRSEFKSALDAASKGASQATQVVLGIIANIIAFVALIFFINGVLGFMAEQVGHDPDDWSVETIVGYVFTPLSFLMGVPWDECQIVGKLVGLKTMVNEFVAFQAMSEVLDQLSPRSRVITTYALCGFSNPSSIGIMISSLSVLVPSKSHVVTKCAFRGYIGGSIVCFMTACIAGMLYPDDLI